MNKAKKASWLILGLYTFVLAFGFSTLPNDQLKDKPSRVHNFSIEAADLLGFTVSFNQSNKSLGESSTSLSRLNFGDYISAAKIAETGRVHLYSKYLAYVRDKVFCFQSPDIIFPFHYFW